MTDPANKNLAVADDQITLNFLNRLDRNWIESVVAGSSNPKEATTPKDETQTGIGPKDMSDTPEKLAKKIHVQNA